jgi:phosphoribosyl 1,2-cyclic phosphodiesterase
VILHHFRNHVQEIVFLKENQKYQLKNLHVSTAVKHVHDVETYGITIHGEKEHISYIADTQFFPDIASYYQGDILIANVVLLSSKPLVKHLSVEDMKKIILKNHPKLTVLTHFGMTMIRAKPWEIAEKLSDETGCRVIAASDGLNIDLPIGEKSKKRCK